MFEDLDKILQRDAPTKPWPLWGRILVGALIAVPALAVGGFFIAIVA